MAMQNGNAYAADLGLRSPGFVTAPSWCERRARSAPRSLRQRKRYSQDWSPERSKLVTDQLKLGRRLTDEYGISAPYVGHIYAGINHISKLFSPYFLITNRS